MEGEQRTLTLQSLLSFERMLTPLIIRGIYIVGVVLCIFGGLSAMFRFGFFEGSIVGLLTAILGVFLVRIVCEGLIVAFRINETLSDIKTLLQKKALS